VKPSNVLVTPAGPMLIDLGIAYALESDDTATRAGTAIGTRSWMSPEQARGQAIGPATDVFGWAATIAFAATGRPPFGSGPADAVLYRVVHEPPDTAGLDGDLGRWVNTALRRDPVARPDLHEIVAGLAGTARPPSTRLLTEPTRPLGGETVGLSEPLDATAKFADRDSTAPAALNAETTAPPRRGLRRPAALVVFVAVLLGLAGLAGFTAYRVATDSSDPPTGRTPASTSARVEPTTAPTDPTDPPSTATTTVVSEVPVVPVAPTDPGKEPKTGKGPPDKAKGPKADR
jgi:serine/threonine protein kinase